MTRWILIATAAVGLGGTFALSGLPLGRSKADGPVVAGSIDRGRYLVQIGGCNDCHTPGYRGRAGDVPEDQWLVGDALGYRGPWGTTYPTNLRHLLNTMREEEWVRFARHIKTRPPMPWFNLRAMAEADLRAIHRYVRSLPANESPVPDFVPPDRQPATAYIVLVPQAPKP